jgi:hypothetical protein
VTNQQTPAGAFPTFRSAPRRLWQAVRWLWRKLWRPAAVLLALLIVAHLTLNVVAGRRLAHELNRLRAEGAPLTLAEAAPPPVPNAENAAVLYLRAFEGLDSLKDSKAIDAFLRAMEGRTRPVTRPTSAEIEAVLARHEADFRLLREASQRPACRFPVDWDAGYGALFPHLAGVRNATRFLAAKAVVDARHGRAGDALSDLAIAIRMSNHVTAEPALISQLVRVACVAIVYGVLPEVLAAAPPTQAQSRAFYDLLSDVDISGPWLHAMQGERSLGLSAFDDVRREGLPAMVALMGRGSRPPSAIARLLNPLMRVVWAPFLKLDEVYCLRQWRENLKIMALPYRQRPKRFEEFEQDMATRSPWYAVVSVVAVPVYSRATQARDEGVARLHLMQAALALRAYQTAHDQYPASLADLRAAGSWAIPDDPFSGTPFVYRRQGAGYLIYSVGPDLKDNRGVSYETAVKRVREGQRLRHVPGTGGRLATSTQPSEIAYDLPLRTMR